MMILNVKEKEFHLEIADFALSPKKIAQSESAETTEEYPPCYLAHNICG